MEQWLAAHREWIGWLVGASVALLLISAVVIPWVVVKIPDDYFSGRKRTPLPFWKRHPLLRVALMVAKNGAGWFFLLAGLAMLILPGQGLVTIVIGLLLIDFPGKYRFERWLAGRRPVMSSLNWIRARAGREPFVLPDEATLPAPTNPPESRLPR